MPVIIEEISRSHDRKAFNCGIPELNQFLQQQARQKNKKQLSKTWVACFNSPSKTIAGYYTLTGYSVMTPPEHKDYTRYPHPLNAVKLARLAVDVTSQKKRVGERLLVDAVCRTVLVSEQISTIGLFVDPMTPDVIPFYQQYGFLPVESKKDAGLEMWLPIKTCEEIYNATL